MAKGVATLMDTVFLLAISGVAAAILFTAAASYGRNLEAQASQLVTDYYARQVIRVLSTATINRPNCDTPDYLLAYMKEKVYYGELGDKETIAILEDILSKTLQPLGDAYDYAFVIRTGSSDDSKTYIFIWQHRSGSPKVDGSCYVSSVKDFKGWLVDFRNKHIGAYTYTVPLRLRLPDESYARGYMSIILWPSGLGIDIPNGNQC